MKSAALKFDKTSPLKSWDGNLQWPVVLILPAIFLNKRVVAKCIISCALFSLLFLVSHLAAIATLIHDEKSVREKQAQQNLLAVKEEALTVAFFGEDYLRQLEEGAAVAGFVPIGNAQYLDLPDEAIFARSPGQTPSSGP